MIRKLYLPLLMAVLVAFTASCKKMGPLSPDMFKVNPSPLEVKGGKVNATVDGTFPEKYFNKKAVVTVTPVLVFNGQEAKSTPVSFQGEKVKGNNNTISYKMGGKYTMPVSFDYVPAMRKSELFLEFQVKIKAKTYNLPRVKVADGVISTETLSSAADANPALGADKFQRIINQAYRAQILFLIQQANLRSSQLNSSEMKALQDSMSAAVSAPNRELVGLEISSYASPDGPWQLNDTLANTREKVTQKYMERQMKKGKYTTGIEGKFTAEDWEGFKELMEKSDIQDKDLVLRVLAMYSDPAVRDEEIKKMSSTFDVIAKEILPQLRRSKLTASVNIIGKSDEEIASLAKSNPNALTVEELLYAATLINADRYAIYQKVADIYAQDFRGYNNLGLLEFEAGKLDKAEHYFKKAEKIAPTAPEVQMNLGLIELVKGHNKKAEEYFGRAAAAEGINEALAVLYTQNGDYANAVRTFADAKSNNAAVAQILAKEYNKAKTTLSGIQNPDATTYYLMAVVGARTNNESMVINNLKEAIKMNSSYAKLAATDLEFAKFAGNADFNALVK
ncbi:MAG: tetratricopeptide repeat protein [Bacteroidales bacterium]